MASMSAISPDGRIIIGATVLDILHQAKAAFGPGNVIFQVGEQTVWRWR